LTFAEVPAVPGSSGLASADGREPGSAPLIVAGAIAAAPQIANETPASAQVMTKASEGDNTLLFFLGSLAVPLAGLTVIGALELSRRRETIGQ